MEQKHASSVYSESGVGASIDVWRHELARRKANRLYTNVPSLQQQNGGRDCQRLLVPVSDIMKE